MIRISFLGQVSVNIQGIWLVLSCSQCTQLKSNILWLEQCIFFRCCNGSERNNLDILLQACVCMCVAPDTIVEPIVSNYFHVSRRSWKWVSCSQEGAVKPQAHSLSPTQLTAISKMPKYWLPPIYKYKYTQAPTLRWLTYFLTHAFRSLIVKGHSQIWTLFQ